MRGCHGGYVKKLNFQNILVPVDFSVMSVVAIETAKRLARQFGSRIHLVHVQDAMYPVAFMATTPMMTGDLMVIHQENTKKLQKDLGDLAARLDVSPDDCHVLTAPPAFDAICAFAQQRSIDLIVMPTHGWTGLKHVFLGSTAERVVQHSPCPVWIARKRPNGVNTILVPVDFSRCSLDALTYAIELAKNAAAKIIVFHAVHLGYTYTTDGYAMYYDLTIITKALRKDAERQMRQFVRAAKFGGVKFETAIGVGAAVQEICAVATGRDIDLIITPTHGRTGFKHLLIGSVAEQIVRHSDRPVIVVPSHPEIRAAIQEQRREGKRIVRAVRRDQRSLGTRICTASKYRGPASPFPERRKTNKFRESHARVSR